MCVLSVSSVFFLLFLSLWVDLFFAKLCITGFWPSGQLNKADNDAVLLPCFTSENTLLYYFKLTIRSVIKELPRVMEPAEKLTLVPILQIIERHCSSLPIQLKDFKPRSLSLSKAQSCMEIISQPTMHLLTNTGKANQSCQNHILLP